MNKHLYCIIMAGGTGTRFWPMSRMTKPKQFIDVLGEGYTLIQETFNRLKKICPIENIIVVTSSNYAEIVQEQLPEILPENILKEPARRNTAPCIAYAAHRIHSKDKEAVMVVSPSDHLIKNKDDFVETINTAVSVAEKENHLMTLGIVPSRPDTGYGYIQFKDNELEIKKLRKVKTFTEKPYLELAETFIKSGDFLWNSGIFIWSTESIISALDKYVPDINKLFAKGENIYGTPNEKEFIYNTYMECKNISIDYAVMEKAENVYVLISDFGWSDLGTWSSLYENHGHDKNGNAIVGKNVMIYDTKNCIIHMPKEKMVLLQGLEDYIVVEENEILMVVRKKDEQNIRKFVNDVMIEKGEQFI